MSDQSSKPPNGAAEPTPQPQRRSVREVAEAVYDDLLDQDAAANEGGDDQVVEQPVDGAAQPRDASGRFLPKDQGSEPGEADGQPAAPAPKIESPSEGETPQPAPAPTGRSIEAPSHWSAEDRAAFAKLPPEGQAFLARRHEAMERDYTQKTQASAEAVDFVKTVAPTFSEPLVAASLQQAGVSPSEAIRQWGIFHRQIMDPNPQVRVDCLREIARRAQIDPAVFAQGRPGTSTPPPLTEEELKNPAIRFFVDTVGKLQQEIQTNRQEFHQMRDQQATRHADEVQRQTEWQINNFADEVDARGNKLRPYFDAVINEIMLLYKADPNQDISVAYERATWMNPEIRAKLQQAGQQAATQQASNARAAQAAKSNLRGRTTPVSTSNGTTEKRSLRETLEAAADEVGIN